MSIALPAFSMPLDSLAPSVPSIIFDTDMGPDYDDVGALATLHALAARGECEILATLSCNKDPESGAVIELLNGYFERGDLPVGVPKGNAVTEPDRNQWLDSLLLKFHPEPHRTNEYFPSAVSVYRKVLAAQPDSSVTIVTVGFFTNLSHLLRSPPDEHSSLKGLDLVKKKVKNLVSMAGKFPDGSEFNIRRDAISSQYVVEHWPTSILFSGYTIGFNILTGQKVSQQSVQESPVAWSYYYNLQNWGNKPVTHHRSYDQTAVLAAVYPSERYFYHSQAGQLVVSGEGNNYWNPEVNANHRFLIHKYPRSHIANLLEELMAFKP